MLHSESFLTLLFSASFLFQPALGALRAEFLRVRRGSTPSMPISPGTTENCVSWYDNDGAVDCDMISWSWGIELEDFLQWNPSITADCGNFQQDYSYCIEVSDVTTSATSAKPTTSHASTTTTKTSATKTTTTGTTTTTKAGNGVETPTPIQPGMVTNCNKFYFVQTGDTCDTLVKKYGISQAQLSTWNPKVGSTCTGLWAATYACVGIIGGTPTTPDDGTATPSPIQAGMVKNCNKFHLVKTTTTCTSIEAYYTLPFATFYKWNPAIGSNCQSLLANYYVCVSVEGWKPTPTEPGNGIATPTPIQGGMPTPTDPGNGIETPSPIQSGMVKTCNKFHLVKSTTTCASIESYYTLPQATFYKWNPAVGTNIIGWTPTPTNPGNGISTPTPIQTGMTKSCKKFHLVKSTTTCASIQDYYSITFANLYKWNPAIGSKCTTLWAQYYVCVAVL
ncbi:hypothetical protein B0J13DRAFT_642947 [Dactylonectria estremocensis]|uniref:LysM domain-containing protein n=1 Tax=Dactylonectria estremocensis TaxID=1079267 RepID=A0A9P9FDB0_9HYPO|nr:hypothetical protein B0J13DRAFT_642947 [Dactylonectria estremocensis]